MSTPATAFNTLFAALRRTLGQALGGRTPVVRGYCWQGLWPPLVFLLGLFTLLWLAPETLPKLLQGLTQGHIPFPQALALLAVNVPPALLQALPVSALLAPLLWSRRLNHTLEWTAMLSLGVPLSYLWRHVLAFGLALALVYWVLQNAVLPFSGPVRQGLNTQYQQHSSKPKSWVVPLPQPLFAGLFSEEEAAKAPPLAAMLTASALPTTTATLAEAHTPPPLTQILYWAYHPVDAQALSHEPTLSQLYQAKSGQWVEGIQPGLWLHQAHHVRFDVQGIPQTQRMAAHLFLPLPAPTVALLALQSKEPEWLSVWELPHYVSLLKQHRLKASKLQAQALLLQRWLEPLALVLLVALGLLLGTSEAPRQRRLRPLLGAAAVLFSFSVAKPLLGQLVSLNLLSPFWSAVLPLVLLAIWLVALLPCPVWVLFKKAFARR